MIFCRPLSANLMDPTSAVYKDYMRALDANLTLEDLDLSGDQRDVPKNIIDLLQSKSRLAAIMTSHCKTDSKRLEVIEMLNKINPHLVDVYGSCGKLKCRTRNPLDTWCWNEVLKPKYYFYFSMENTMCNEYITEKLYYPLIYGLVPVVYGGKINSTNLQKK